MNKKSILFLGFMLLFIVSLIPSVTAVDRPCSSTCESGSECNKYGNPSEGKVW